MKLEKGQEINGLRARIFKKTPGAGLITAEMEIGDTVIIDRWAENGDCILAHKEGYGQLHEFFPSDLEVFKQ